MDFTKFKGIIFDLDGTLVESNGVWSQIDIDFLGKRGFAVPDDYGKVVSAMDFRQAAIYTKEPSAQKRRQARPRHSLLKRALRACPCPSRNA